MSITSSAEGALPLTIYAVLKGEHREVSALFKVLESTPKVESVREVTFKKLQSELISHSIAEQEVVYPMLSQKTNNTEIIDEAQSDHAEIERLLDSIQMANANSDDWKNRVEILKEKVEHHVKEEETQMFEEMQNIFDEDEAKAMAKEFREVKKRELEAMK